MKNDGFFWIVGLGAAVLITVASGGGGWPMLVVWAVCRAICQPFYNTVNYAERTIGYQESGCSWLVGCGATLLIVALFVGVAMVALLGEREAGLLIEQLAEGLER